MLIRCSLCGTPAVSIAECADGDRPACRRCGDDIGLSFRKLPKIGSGMLAALVEIYAHPGQVKGHVVRTLVAPARFKVGYAIIDRCILAGLVEQTRDGSAYRVSLTRLGELITPYPSPTV